MIDIKELDGEVWEVADIAGKQYIQRLDEALSALDDFFWASRGSWLSQTEYRTGSMPDAAGFTDDVIGRKLASASEVLSGLRAEARHLNAASAYDPRDF